jgi:hypothetical protein
MVVAVFPGEGVVAGVEPQAVIARMLAQISETKTNLLKLILHSK